MVDGQEEHPTLEGLLELLDCETGEEVKVGVTPALLRRYREHFERWTDDLNATCRANRAYYVYVPTAVSPQTLVLSTRRHDGIVR